MLPLLRNISRRKLLLIAGDLCIVSITLVLAGLQFFPLARFWYLTRTFWWTTLIAIFLWPIVIFLAKGYDTEEVQDRSRTASILATVTVVVLILQGFLFFSIPGTDFSRRILFTHGLFVFILLFLWRTSFAALISLPRFTRRTLILGTNWQARRILDALIHAPSAGLRPVGVVSLDPQVPAPHTFGEALLPVYAVSDFSDVIGKERIQTIIVAATPPLARDLARELLRFTRERVIVLPFIELYSSLEGRIPLRYLTESTEFLSFFKPASPLRLAWEGIANTIVALVLGILLLPLALLTAIAILAVDGWPILFIQKRWGQYGRPFNLIKFRTMRNLPLGADFTSGKEDEKRITPLGNFLRKTRLDEIPQLWNILVRQMNFIGPRPDRSGLAQTFAAKIPFYRERYLMKPGVTGWAQVKHGYGFTESHTREKLEYELYYMKYRSILFDLIIILKTLEVIFTGRGAR
ncbi:MAG: exopolysaccharide biosynthesis polyprenyl glycosylphosphotransferase [Parcubacteria group bacterium]|nr:exopolysaccharide biosynthesis polyprenyl glycosylphosphotransferase [Parcubacteria group bacterium]